MLFVIKDTTEKDILLTSNFMNINGRFIDAEFGKISFNYEVPEIQGAWLIDTKSIQDAYNSMKEQTGSTLFNVQLLDNKFYISDLLKKVKCEFMLTKTDKIERVTEIKKKKKNNQMKVLKWGGYNVVQYSTGDYLVLVGENKILMRESAIAKIFTENNQEYDEEKTINENFDRILGKEFNKLVAEKATKFDAVKHEDIKNRVVKHKGYSIEYNSTKKKIQIFKSGVKVKLTVNVLKEFGSDWTLENMYEKLQQIK